MRIFLLFALLCLPFAAQAQSETCPRVWRGGDTLWTDPAPHIQWLREGQAIPDANRSWFLPPPTERARYSVEVRGGFSPAFSYDPGAGYALAGYIFDELHRPVAGATVRQGSFSATTDDQGRFALEIQAMKPAERTPVVVMVEREGYWRNMSRQYVSRFYTTETRIMLHTRRVTNRVDATQGGEMAYQGFTLRLPPDAVQSESGIPYNGTILLSVEGSTPSNADFGLRMPGGDFSAIDENGSDVMLYSYGYLRAEMTTESGEKLELRPEARATLRFSLPWNETRRPDRVPLWHFNENAAVWEQEGWSVRNGSIYEGQVSHFSSWNCDIPAERGVVRGRVVDCNGEPIGGGWVRVGQRNVVADSAGNYWAFVPANLVFDVWTQSDTLRDISMPAQEERTLEDLTGISFSGLAVYNPVSEALSVYLSGNVPENLRLSIDGGQTWTGEREFTDVRSSPEAVLVDDACTDRLRLFILPRVEDCRMLDSLGLANAPRHESWEAALASEAAVSRVRFQSGSFDGNWDLLSSFSCLQELGISGNQFGGAQLTSLPESIGNLMTLQSLSLANHLLTSLPENIGNLTALRYLNLSNNDLTFLPESISKLTALEELHLYDNELASLPESFGSLRALQGLSLFSCNLTELPESFGNLTALKSVDFINNNLTSLPESFGNLRALERLSLFGNNLTSLPEGIGNFTALQSLDLRYNQLTTLPQSIGNLAALEWLSLDGNNLTSLPESIGNLTALEELSLGFAELERGNSLTSLPESIGNLVALQKLSLEINNLTDLPASIADLADTLQELRLTGNPIPVERRAAIQAMLPNTTIYW